MSDAPTIDDTSQHVAPRFIASSDKSELHECRRLVTKRSSLRSVKKISEKILERAAKKQNAARRGAAFIVPEE